MHGYFAGGAGDERTLRENVAAFARYTLHPRVLVDVGEVSTRDDRARRPRSRCRSLVAPVAFQRLVDPDGEVAMARAAAARRDGDVPVDDRHVAPGEIAAEAPAGAALVSALLLPRPRGHRGADRRGGRVRVRGDRADRRRAARRAARARPADRLRRSRRTSRRRRVAAAVGSDRPITPQEVFELVDPTLDLGRPRGARRRVPAADRAQGRADGRGRGARGRARRRRR